MEAPEIYDANLVVKGKRHPAGRFMVKDGQAHILSDYHGRLAAHVPTGPVDDLTMSRIKRPPADMDIVSRSDRKAGRYLHDVPEAELQPLPQGMEPPPTAAPVTAMRPPAVFHYQRVGMSKPHVVEIAAGKASLDGHPLTDDEARLVIQNARTGVATLRYKHQQVPMAMAKAEVAFARLAKEEEDLSPHEALGHLDDLVAKGHLDPKVAKYYRRLEYEDRMVPGVGNKHAWEEHRGKGMPGVYGSLDLNDFKTVNDVHGHDAGDAAIRAFGRAAREAADESGARQHLKIFRPGGDEFTFHATAPEHAYTFLRALRGKLDQIPPINGVHQISMSAGLGHDFPTADKALYQAKAQKFHPGTKDRKFAPGEVPNLAHSLVPGAEGAIPLDTSQLPLSKLPEGARIKMPEEPKESAPAPGPEAPRVAAR